MPSDINKVSLEFGIEVGGEPGIPYITKGTAKSNIKVTLECNFSQNKESI
ncbi:MAG: CU044_2847 family protein [Cyanobacteriota bacterium ELA615]